jgi:hypothetical protein
VRRIVLALLEVSVLVGLYELNPLLGVTALVLGFTYAAVQQSRARRRLE